MGQLVVNQRGNGVVVYDHQAEVQKAVTLHQNRNAANTERAYSAAWRGFTDWCAVSGIEPLQATPAAVVLYVSHLANAGRTYSTINQHMAAITNKFTDHHLTPPTKDSGVKGVIRGFRREVADRAPDRKSPATAGTLRAMVDTIPLTKKGIRDRALLLLGFTGAFRRSELVALTTADIQETTEGLTVTLRKSKTDQFGQGRIVPVGRGSVNYCPVRALGLWLQTAGIQEGPLFRAITKAGTLGATPLTDRAVVNIIKQAATDAGLNPTAFSGHSLRSGFLTSAAMAGKDLASLQRVSGHKSLDILLNTYIRPASVFDNYAGEGLL